MSDMKRTNNIEQQVKNQLCFQCGTCESICPNNSIVMELNEKKGLIYPKINRETCIECGKCISVCPINNVNTDINKHLLKEDEIVNVYNAMDDLILKNSTSGGLVTSIISYLFDKKIINKAIVVGMDESNPIKAKPYIVSSKKDLRPGSVYQPVALNKVLKDITEEDRIAYVGLPCHIRGLNQYINLNRKLENSIFIKIGLLCTIGRGLNGTKLAIQKHGIKEEDVNSLKYRVGLHPSSMLINNKKKIEMGEYLKYIDFIFYPKGCSYCNDLFNDECDVAVGDPWGKVDEKVAMAILYNKNLKYIMDDMEKEKYIQQKCKLDGKQTMETQKNGVKFKIHSYKERIALYRKLGIKDNIDVDTSNIKVKLNIKNIGLCFLMLNSVIFNSKFGVLIAKYIPSKLLLLYRQKVYNLCTK